jgi:peptidoglycan-associated lipoprotein
MKILSHSLLPVLALTSTAALTSACADKQTHAATPGVTAMQGTEEPPATEVGIPKAQPVVPNTASATNVHITDEIARACNISDSNAYFGFDSSRLTSFDLTPLDQLATCFSTGPLAGRTLVLIGHADPRGTADYNMTLGQSRADAVAEYLFGRGVRADHATTSSRGSMDATGQDEVGWARDRRVDVALGR